MAAVRDNVVPSRMTLAAYRDRVKAAQRGFSLLKKKSDALKSRLRQILKEILRTKVQMGANMKNASFSHTEATWAAGDFNDQVIDHVSDEASYRVTQSLENITGVKIPVFRSDKLDTDDMLVGLSKGGRQITKCRDTFTAALDDLVRLATLQTSVVALDQALKVTNRRVNALEFFVVPRFENTVKYIMSELDEVEREDMFRLKKVVANKLEADELEEAENNKRADVKKAAAGKLDPGAVRVVAHLIKEPDEDIEDVVNLLDDYEDSSLVINDLDL